jgi:hypothetical protein
MEIKTSRLLDASGEFFIMGVKGGEYSRAISGFGGLPPEGDPVQNE